MTNITTLETAATPKTFDFEAWQEKSIDRILMFAANAQDRELRVALIATALRVEVLDEEFDDAILVVPGEMYEVLKSHGLIIEVRPGGRYGSFLGVILIEVEKPAA